MAYGDIFNTETANWGALSQNDKLQQLGFRPNYTEGFGYDIPDQYKTMMSYSGDNTTDLNNFLSKVTQFDKQKFYNDQGIVTGYANQGQDGAGATDEQRQAYSDNFARSFNQFGFNFGGYDDYLKHMTGAGHYEQDPTLGKTWVPDNHDYNSWNNSAMEASGAPQGGALAQFIGNAANSGAFVKAPAMAILGAGAGDIFNGGANSFSNIFNQATGGTNASWGVNPRDGMDLADPFSSPEIGEVYDKALNLGNGGSALNPSGNWLEQALNDGSMKSTAGSGLPLGASAPTSLLSRLLGGNGTNGSGISSDLMKLLGIGGTTLAGVLGSNKAADTLKGIYDQQRSDRAPALAAYNGALANPDSFYQTAPAMGAADAAARALSVQGNPAWNPGLSAKLAANNLGGYNSYLNNLAGPAFGGQVTQAATGGALANAQNNTANTIGAGITAATTPTQDLGSFMKQFGNLYELANGKGW